MSGLAVAPMNSHMGTRPRLVDIDRCKGVAIGLVVLGHVVARELPAGNEWFGWVRTWIYLFHMPLFMFLSGFVLFWNYPQLGSVADYGRFVGRRAERLWPAYLLFGLLTLTGKMVAVRFLHVDNVPASWWEGLWLMVVKPAHSAANSLWYIYVYFAYCVVVPPLLAASRGRLEPWLVVGLGLQWVVGAEWFCSNKLAEYALIFLLGGYAAQHHERYFALVDRWWPVAAVGFVGLLVSRFWMIPPKHLVGALSVVTMHGLCRLRCWGEASDWLVGLGRYTFPIYLMNTLAIGVVKGVIFKFTTWDDWRFFWVGPVLLAAGLWVPVVVKQQLLRRLPWLDRITG